MTEQSEKEIAGKEKITRRWSGQQGRVSG